MDEDNGERSIVPWVESSSSNKTKHGPPRPNQEEKIEFDFQFNRPSLRVSVHDIGRAGRMFSGMDMNQNSIGRVLLGGMNYHGHRGTENPELDHERKMRMNETMQEQELSKGPKGWRSTARDREIQQGLRPVTEKGGMNQTRSLSEDRLDRGLTETAQQRQR